MLKKMILLSLAASFLLFSAGSVLAIDVEAGNKRKGKYTYRKFYKQCHARGGIETTRPLMNPDAKTQDQWVRTFERQSFDDFKCEEEWSNLSEKDLQDIFAYLHAHAADSPTPAKCKP